MVGSKYILHIAYNSMIFSKKIWLKFFSQVDIVVRYWFPDFEVFWCKNWVVWSWRNSAWTAILLLPAPNGPNFESFIPLSFCTKTPQIRQTNSWLNSILCLVSTSEKGWSTFYFEKSQLLLYIRRTFWASFNISKRFHDLCLWASGLLIKNFY